MKRGRKGLNPMLSLVAFLGAVMVGSHHAARVQRHLDSMRDSLRASPSSHPLASRGLARASADSTFGRWMSGAPYAAPAAHAGTAAASRVIRVATDFKADPTGATDSSPQLEAAMAALLGHNGSAPAVDPLARGVRNLGGAVLDLEGGVYSVSRPVAIPGFVGNLVVRAGTLQALSHFPAERYVLEVGMDEAACKVVVPGQKVCNENVNVQNVMVDAMHVAKGCIEVNSTMGGSLGPDLFLYGFREGGLTLNGGHEMMLHESWLAAYYYDDRRKTNSSLVGGSSAVQLFGPDHVLSDVIIFGGQTAVNLTAPATLLQGVHAWNDATLQGGHGIVAGDDTSGWNPGARSLRITGCYMDYTAMVLVDPSLVTVLNSFFLGMGTLVLRAGPKGTVDGLTLMGNAWVNVRVAAPPRRGRC